MIFFRVTEVLFVKTNKRRDKYSKKCIAVRSYLISVHVSCSVHHWWTFNCHMGNPMSRTMINVLRIVAFGCHM